MHRILSASAFLLLSLLLFVPHSFAVIYTINGDVSEWGTIDWANLNTVTLNSDSADKVTGDGTLRPGVGGQAYDVEAMFFDSDSTYGYLALITGFPIGGRDSGGIPFGPGDIGIDVTSDTATVLDHQTLVTDSTTPYEFGIIIPSSEGAISADLMDVTSWRSAYYEQHEAEADPWLIYASSKVGNATFAYGDPSNDHYIYEFAFELEKLGIKYGDPVNFHWTMECGNDYLNLPATVNHTPEPASMLLLGTGLLGIASISRKKFKK